jgi:hypothetical protein
MDLDDRLLHYLIIFCGMWAGSALQRVADLTVADAFRWLRRRWAPRRRRRFR